MKQPTLSAYTVTVQTALKKLEIAAIYANDGGHTDAILCAAEAIGLLAAASRQRAAFLSAPTEHAQEVRAALIPTTKPVPKIRDGNRRKA